MFRTWLVIPAILIHGTFTTISFAAAALPQTRPAIESLPASRGGQDLLGKPMPVLQFDRWLNTQGNRPPELAHSVTLYRWWTDGCPFCAKTLPAIEKFQQEFGPQGLKVVAVYHPKPPRDVADATILEAAKRIGYDGAIAVDSHWVALRQLWLSTGRRNATSASFLVDRDGNIRFVHPGVEFFPSNDPEDAEHNQDYLLMRQAIACLLAEGPATRPAGGPLSDTDAEDVLIRIPEIATFLDSVATLSHGDARGLIFNDGDPKDNDGSYQFYVGADHDDYAVDWYRFRVNRMTGIVTVLDAAAKKWVSVEQWRAGLKMAGLQIAK
jgi:thiol-disulfide isomerase/thioredoxin